MKEILYNAIERSIRISIEPEVIEILKRMEANIQNLDSKIDSIEDRLERTEYC